MLVLLDYYVIDPKAEKVENPEINIILINFDTAKYVKQSSLPGNPETKSYYVQIDGEGFHLTPSSFEDFILQDTKTLFSFSKKKKR